MSTGGADLPLAIWMSPMFPVGAFAYSQGLEWAFEAGDLPDAAALQDWLEILLRRGAPRNDAILLAEAYRAAAARDEATLAETGELALALANSRERHLETTTQGGAFLLAIEKSWPSAALDLLDRSSGTEIAYPVAVGVAAAGHGLALLATLEMTLLGNLSNLVSAALRLGAIGQTDGQKILAALLPAVMAVAQDCAQATLDDLGSSAFRADLASLRHETQYTRLFRS